MAFFQNLQFSIRKGIVNRSDAVELFGAIYTWRDIVCVKGDYPKRWDSNERFNKLRDIVKSVSEENGFPLEAW